VSTVEEITAAIEALPVNDFSRLRRWFLERDWRKWDDQIETDSQAGQLDFLVAEANEEKGTDILGEPKQ
jgi:hypothetical protein